MHDTCPTCSKFGVQKSPVTQMNESQFGWEDCVLELLATFVEQAMLLRSVIEIVLDHEGEVSGALATLLMAVEDSSRTLVLLGKRHRIRDFW